MGVILYEMLLSITPFCSTTVEDLFEEITNGTGASCGFHNVWLFLHCKYVPKLAYHVVLLVYVCFLTLSMYSQNYVLLTAV